MLCVAYILICVALAVFLKENLILLSLILVLNIYVIYKVGVTAVRSLVFPFSFWAIKYGINGQATIRYA
jgi:hypothetical protein